MEKMENQKLNNEELKEVSGGAQAGIVDVVQQLKCKAGRHEWESTDRKSGEGYIEYIRWKCLKCNEVKYEMTDYGTGEHRPLSEGEFWGFFYS